VVDFLSGTKMGLIEHIAKIRVPNMLGIPISHVLDKNTNDVGHGHSWTCVIYILSAQLIGGLVSDEEILL
jgi:hypothetical protein